jgi:hypothetical protein
MVHIKYLTHFDSLILMGSKYRTKNDSIEDKVLFVLSGTFKKIGPA